VTKLVEAEATEDIGDREPEEVKKRHLSSQLPDQEKADVNRQQGPDGRGRGARAAEAGINRGRVHKGEKGYDGLKIGNIIEMFLGRLMIGVDGENLQEHLLGAFEILLGFPGNRVIKEKRYITGGDL